MLNYPGSTCEVCSKTFTKDSDVVVCPVCGTPHHRDCWNSLHHCVNEDKHAEGFVWQAPEFKSDANSVLCPDCKSINPKDALFCENCGKALNSKPQPHIPAVAQDIRSVAGGEPYVQPSSVLTGDIDGVSYKDIAIYVGPSAPYFVFKFKRLQKEGKSYHPFCWSSCIFAPFYLFYRKMWGMGAIFTIIMMALNFPMAVLMMQNLGVLASNSPLLFTGIESVASIANYLSIALSVFLGFMAIPWYKKQVIKDIKNIKNRVSSDQEYYRLLVAKSGPSKIVLFFAVLLSTLYILQMFTL